MQHTLSNFSRIISVVSNRQEYAIFKDTPIDFFPEYKDLAITIDKLMMCSSQ